MSANHKPKKWKGIQIEAGQFITSRDKLSAELPLSVQQVRTALDKLKSTGEITIKTTTKYSMISITNWSKYQESNQPINKQVTIKQPTSNQQVTTNNNDNNEDNVNKKPKATKGCRLSQDSLPDEWKLFCNEERPDLNPSAVFDGFRDYWIGIAGAKGVKLDWLATWRNWVRNQKTNQMKVQNNGYEQKDTRSRAQKVSDKLDEIAKKDIESNGFASTLD
jgi:biotin operon repressor